MKHGSNIISRARRRASVAFGVFAFAGGFYAGHVFGRRGGWTLVVMDAFVSAIIVGVAIYFGVSIRRDRKPDDEDMLRHLMREADERYCRPGRDSVRGEPWQ